MNQVGFMNNLSRTFHNIGFQLKKHSPEILAVAGTVGVVASAVMACVATTKVDGVLKDAKKKIETIHEAEAHGCTQMGEEYTPQQAKHDLTVAYLQTGVEFVKLYGPAVLLGGTSIAAMLGSNHILRKRYHGAAAAFATTNNAFKDYRNNVVERFGADLDRELKYGIKAQEVEEKVVDEDGNEKTVKKIVNVTDVCTPSEYAFFFDDGCFGWEKDAEHNKVFLMHAQAMFNDRLQARGHLFLNEVYDYFGIPRSRAGQIVGWTYSDNPGKYDDNYVDFGIFDSDRVKCRDFVNGRERTILIEPNVQGNVWELMK